MTATPPTRRATRATAATDLPQFDVGDLDAATRAALAELLLSMADDEFVIGFWDSEWTGIAPMLEEDVAFSSLAQDEIGHARLLYEMLAQLSDGTADTSPSAGTPTNIATPRCSTIREATGHRASRGDGCTTRRTPSASTP